VKTIEVDDDVYYYLLGRTTEGQVSFSDLMRRAFGLDGGLWQRPGADESLRQLARRELASIAREGAPPSDVEAWLRSPRFLAETTSLGRYMMATEPALPRRDHLSGALHDAAHPAL